MEHAACREVEDPDIFFPNRDTDRKVKVAKAICADCPVSDQCLNFGLTTPSSVGIWGGTTNSERAEIRRQHRRN